MTEFLGYLICGIMVGSIYSLIALGFVLIYKASGVLNLAQGELVIIGAYFALTFLSIPGLPWAIGAVLTFLSVIFMAFLIERFALRPMIGQPILALILMTLGLSMLLRGLMSAFWGDQTRLSPLVFPEVAIRIGGFTISYQYLWAFIICLTFLIIFSFFFKFTKIGLAMRAVADDQQASQSLGIPIFRIFRNSWIISGIISAVGGILLTSITGIHYSLTVMGLKSVSVVIIGGLESIAGSVVAGPLVGAIEYMAAGYIDPLVGGGFRDVAAYIVLIIVLIVRPYGFFGWKRIERV